VKFLLLVVAVALLARRGHVNGAAFLWCLSVAIFHAREEAKGRLWAYFGRIARSPFFTHCEWGVGFYLIVFPALALQAFASWRAFRGDDVSVFWLALLIGARVGDALFSHAIPFASGELPWRRETDPDEPVQLNPGLATAAVYAVDGLALALMWWPSLAADPRPAILGAAIGAAFFASVIPGLRLTRWL
jgi:hypothetical protein